MQHCGGGAGHAPNLTDDTNFTKERRLHPHDSENVLSLRESCRALSPHTLQYLSQPVSYPFLAVYHNGCVCRHSLVGEFERELFGHSGEQVSQPVLTVEDYSQHCSKLSGMVATLEQNIKTLLKDYDGKKKVMCNIVDSRLSIFR